MKWDDRFLKLAQHVSQWSKDPSTKVGAVIVRPDRTIASVGYNGFPRGMDDNPTLYYHREIKYERMVHAEMNAILNAKEPLEGHTLYIWPMFTCDRCAVHVIQSGIKRVVAPILPDSVTGTWSGFINSAQDYYDEAGVEWEEIK